MSLPTDDELVAFVLHEARLLNDARYDDWLALYAEAGRYWIPLLGAAQQEGGAHTSIADDGRLMLALRVDRLKNPRAHSLHPRCSSQHIVQVPQVEHRDDAGGTCELYTPFLYVEARGDDQVTLAGHWRHRLCLEGGSLRIALKRVNLVNAAARLPMIQLFP